MSPWPGGLLEYLTHINQIGTCSGHPENVKNYCKQALQQQNYPEGLRLDSSTECEYESESTTGKSADFLNNPTESSSGINTKVDLALRKKKLPQPALSDSISSVNPTSTNRQIVTTRTRSSPAKLQGSVSATNSVQHILCTTNNDVQSSFNGAIHRLVPSQSSSSPAKRLLEHLDNDPDRSVSSSLPSVMVKRYRSMPPVLNFREPISSGALSWASRLQQLEQPQQQSITVQQTDSELLSSVKRLEETVKSLEASLNRPASNPQPAAGNVYASAPTRDNVESSRPQRKKKKSNAEKKASGQPELPANIPHHDRLPDHVLIEIGKIVNGYARRQRASYAFAWSGRLRSEYDYLLTIKDENGNYVWDRFIIARLKRS